MHELNYQQGIFHHWHVDGIFMSSGDVVELFHFYQHVIIEFVQDGVVFDQCKTPVSTNITCTSHVHHMHITCTV